MAKEAATRTFSIGAIGSDVLPNDYSAGRRHSSAGVRALLWATSGSRSFGCSLGSSRENSFPNILTPDSIPQFTIPSLMVQNGLKTQESDAEPEEGWGGSQSSGMERTESSASSSSSGSRLELSGRKAERSDSVPLRPRRSHLQREASYPRRPAEAQHCLDPASRAALSLPHLAKVTTPYGFITLSQSPQMANEEELLCQSGLRRSNRDEEAPAAETRPAVCRTEDPQTDSQTDSLPSSLRRQEKLRQRLRLAIRKHIPFCNRLHQ